jgi:hypothetical protein
MTRHPKPGNDRANALPNQPERETLEGTKCTCKYKIKVNNDEHAPRRKIKRSTVNENHTHAHQAPTTRNRLLSLDVKKQTRAK